MLSYQESQLLLFNVNILDLKCNNAASHFNGLTISLICTIVPAKLSGKIDLTRSILLGLIVPIGWTKSQVPFLSIAPAVLLFEKSWHVRPTKLSSISLIVNVSRHH